MHEICVDARLIPAPGIGTYLKNLFSHFKHTAYKWYALVHPDAKNRLSSWDFIEPICISSPIYGLREHGELSMKIPKVDLFWSPHYNVPCLPIRARRRLVTIHDAFHLAHKKILNMRQRAYAHLMMRAALKLSAHVITPSHFSKSEIRMHTGIENQEVSVIPYGVDREHFSPGSDREQAQQIVQKYGIKRPFVLYVGSFKAHKNLKSLIQAFSLLPNRSLDLVIVGMGGSKSEEPLLGVESVRCVGHVPDEELPHFYRAAKVFIFPSLYEGFGFPPLEAMSSGCPTLVTRAGALPEVCGEGVFYIDPNTPEHIAKTLSHLLGEEQKLRDLAQRGRQRSRDFCWKKCAQAHLAIIERLIIQ
jgi:glycosyltransferase involved in cell wall biosynthesis